MKPDHFAKDLVRKFLFRMRKIGIEYEPPFPVDPDPIAALVRVERVNFEVTRKLLPIAVSCFGLDHSAIALASMTDYSDFSAVVGATSRAIQAIDGSETNAIDQQDKDLFRDTKNSSFEVLQQSGSHRDSELSAQLNYFYGTEHHYYGEFIAEEYFFPNSYSLLANAVLCVRYASEDKEKFLKRYSAQASWGRYENRLVAVAQKHVLDAMGLMIEAAMLRSGLEAAIAGLEIPDRCTAMLKVASASLETSKSFDLAITDVIRMAIEG